MILEYAAGAALGDLRAFSAPASLGHAVLSRGVEEQAGLASLAARQTLRACEAFRLVVGCELVAAVRALRQRELRLDPEQAWRVSSRRGSGALPQERVAIPQPASPASRIRSANDVLRSYGSAAGPSPPSEAARSARNFGVR